ncbi:MAG: dTDP-4-dehydrorhamnose 3,5-epimerase [Candidatus Limnocylindrales bacterium]
MPFTVEPTSIAEVLIVRPRVFPDERGWFTEVLRADSFEPLGLPTRFVQVNQSRSTRGVVRGLHFQWDPPQGKLMRVVTGRAFMVAVDIRPGSPTLGQHVAVEGSADEPVLFWAPACFARGFCALSDVTEVEYFCTGTYNPACESAIRWDDPTLAIPWPVAEPLTSPKDAAAGTLADWLARPESAAFDWERWR